MGNGAKERPERQDFRVRRKIQAALNTMPANVLGVLQRI